MNDTTTDRAALVERLQNLLDKKRVDGAYVVRVHYRKAMHAAAALIEADGRLIALADAAPHTDSFCTAGEPYGQGECVCWKSDYDAAKEAL